MHIENLKNLIARLLYFDRPEVYYGNIFHGIVSVF